MIVNRLPFFVLATVMIVSPAFGQSSKLPDAETIHQRILTLDSHADVLLPATPQRYFLPDGGSRVDLPRLVAGGVDAVVLAVAAGPGPRTAAGVAEARKEADQKLALIKAFVADNSARVGLALSADDVERLHKQGKISVLIGFQNARSIGKDPTQLDIFYKEGARIFGFTHAAHNDFADSSRPVNEPDSEHGGLSPLGREAVRRLNDLGALIDVSQLSTAALFQTLQLTRAPVAATHSAARGLVEDTRNLSDAELDAIKANDGVVQVVPYSGYVHKQDQATVDRIAVLRQNYGLSPNFKMIHEGISLLPPERQNIFINELAAAIPPGTLSDFVDHIDYIAKRIGWKHVGIGTDFDHGSGVIGFNSEAEAPNITRELVRRGYNEQQIAAIWGGNFLRVLRAAESKKAKAVR